MINPIINKIRKKEEDNSVSIGIVGDVSFHNIDIPSIDFFTPLISVMQNTDIVIANIETVVSNRNLLPIKKQGIFLKSDPNFLKLLKKIGVDIALLANNHIDDYGLDGIHDSIEALNKEEILSFGVKGLEELSINKKGISFRLRGVVTPYESDEFLTSYGKSLNSIEMVESCDASHLIYFIHGFDELYSIPFPWRVKLLKQIRDKVLPAALISGHQHIYQGYSLGEIPICWSYGNGFISIDYHSKSNIDATISCYSVLHFDKKGCYQIDEYYYRFSQEGISILSEHELKKVLDRVRKGSECTKIYEQNECLWEEECYENYNTHRFKQNIVINFLYDIYRFYRFRKQIKYIHYRYMFLGYLKRKWGINLYKLWKYY